MTDASTPNPTTPTPTSSTPPLPNEAAARTSDGTLKDASTPSSVSAPEGESSPPSQEPLVGAPETYSDFTLPEGQTLDKETIAEYLPLFKEMNLSQDAAQRLVDTYAKQTASQESRLLKLVEDTRAQFVADLKADSVIGNKLEAVRTDINRAFTHLPPDVVTAAKAALDYTGGGDHPAIVRAFYELSKLVNEGTPVSGRGPAAEGHTPTGRTERPTAASALYPNLRSASR